jgi:anthranilate 1,2-dioxygenase large subunit
MPRDFDNASHGLKALKVHVEGGSIWASFVHDAPSFADFCGADVHGYVQRIFTGRPLKLLG